MRYLLLLLFACRSVTTEVPCAPREQLCTPDVLLVEVLLSGSSARCIEPVDSVTAYIILAQARWETGDFKSKLFREHNNCFGMMHPSRRNTTSLGPLARAEGRRGYASYRSVQDSGLDMLLWLQYAEIDSIPNPRHYVLQLKKKRFFTDKLKHYSRGVQHYYDRYTI